MRLEWAASQSMYEQERGVAEYEREKSEQDETKRKLHVKNKRQGRRRNFLLMCHFYTLTDAHQRP